MSPPASAAYRHLSLGPIGDPVPSALEPLCVTAFESDAATG